MPLHLSISIALLNDINALLLRSAATMRWIKWYGVIQASDRVFPSTSFRLYSLGATNIITVNEANFKHVHRRV